MTDLFTINFEEDDEEDVDGLPCPFCRGKGIVPDPVIDGLFDTMCPVCQGAGYIEPDEAEYGYDEYLDEDDDYEED